MSSLVLLLQLSCAPITIPDPAPTPGWRLVDEDAFVGDLRARDYRFDNGLRLLVVPDDSAPVVAYQTWYGVGSSDEQAGRTGLAHLFEHMMFKATEDYDADHYDATLGALSASGLNAWTWLDETVYVQSVPAEALPTLVELESVRMRRLLLDRERLDSEREVVINERRLRVDDDPDGALNEQLYAAAFEVSPYGWPTIGWRADLDALTVEDAEAFYRRWYAPDNATIVAVGDVEPDALAALIWERYGDAPASNVARAPLPVEPAQTAQRRLEIELPLAADRLQIGFKAPAAAHPDTPALMVLDAILSGGRSGLLKRALEDPGLASSASAFLVSMQEPGLYEISATAREGVPAEALEAQIFAAVEAAAEGRFSEADLERAKNLLRAETWRGLESASGKASAIGWSLTVAGDWRAGLAELEAIQRVSAEDVRRVAQIWLVPERSTVAIGRARDAERVEVEAPGLSPPDPPRQLEARAVAGAPDQPPRELISTRASGAEILSVYDPTAPLLRLRIGFPSGGAVDAIPGAMNLAAHAPLRGGEGWSREDFEQAVERLGATLDVSVNADATVYSATVLRSAWPEFIALLRSALASPAMRPEDIDDLRDEILNQLTERADDDGALVTRAWLEAWYGPDHPYGRAVEGDPGALAALTPAALRAHWSDHLRSEGAVVGLSGDFDAEALGEVEALLAALDRPAPEGAAPPEIPAVEPPAGRRVIIVDKPGRTQVQLAIGHEAPDHLAEGYPTWRLGSRVFSGGGFQSWLMQEVRVARGWSYFAYGQEGTRQSGGYWAARLAPGAEYATDAAALVLELMERAASEGLEPADLERERDGGLNGAPFLADTAGKVVGVAFDQRLYGYDRLGWLERWPEVEESAVEASLQANLHPDRALIVMVGQADQLQEAAAALGPVEVVPWTDYR